MITEGAAAILLETTRHAFGNQSQSKQRSTLVHRYICLNLFFCICCFPQYQFFSERPKPEFSAETGTGTEIIPVRFRLGNSYRNRNGPLLLL